MDVENKPVINPEFNSHLAAARTLSKHESVKVDGKHESVKVEGKHKALLIHGCLSCSIQ